MLAPSIVIGTLDAGMGSARESVTLDGWACKGSGERLEGAPERVIFQRAAVRPFDLRGWIRRHVQACLLNETLDEDRHLRRRRTLLSTPMPSLGRHAGAPHTPPHTSGARAFPSMTAVTRALFLSSTVCTKSSIVFAAIM